MGKKPCKFTFSLKAKKLLYKLPNRTFIPQKKHSKLFLKDLLVSNTQNSICYKEEHISFSAALIFWLVSYLACPVALRVLQHFP